MKTILFIAVLFILFQDYSLCQANRFEFESAYAKKTSSTVSSGFETTITEKIYIDNFGAREVHIKNEKRNIKMLNKTEESTKVDIIEGEWLISYDPVAKTGTKTKNPFYDKFKDMSVEEQKDLAEGMKDAFKTTTTDAGEEIVAGKNCKVTIAETDMMGMKSITKMWIYKNFVMKLESDALGSKVTEIITLFNENEKPSSDLFTIPADVTISEITLPVR